MKRKITTLFILLFAISAFSWSQGNSETETFTPKGKPIVRIYGDYYTGLSSATNKISGFELTRAYLGYGYQITPSWSGTAIIDAAVPVAGSTRTEVYIKNAFIGYRKDGFILNFGVIPMIHSTIAERTWAHRYIAATFPDEYGMMNSADLGISLDYKFNQYFGADFLVANGEGYRKLAQDNNYRYGLGLTAMPIKSLSVRLYVDLYKSPSAAPEGSTLKYTNQNTWMGYVAYESEKILGGVEYHYQNNNKFIDGADFYGFSLHGSYNINKRFQVFGRYDKINSKTPDNYTQGWSKNDGSIFYGGIQYQPIKNIRIAPNFRTFNPSSGDSRNYVYVNMEFNL